MVLARVMLARRRAQRIATIEGQLETWLGSLANALRSTPSLGEALGVTTDVVRGPIAEEVDTLLKQTRLGPGYFQTNLDTYYNQRHEIVGTNVFSLLRYGVKDAG